MENHKNNKGLYVIIAVLCILVLLLLGYIIYDKVLKNDIGVNNNDTNKDNTNINQDDANGTVNTSSYNNWIDYIMNTDINSIKLNYCVEDSLSDVGIPTKKTVDITKNDLNRIFVEMKRGTIYKNYYGGLGGPCMKSIDIDYATNNGQYELRLILYRLIDPSITKDQKIISYLENANYTIKKYNEDIDLNTEPYMFEYIYNEEIVDTIVDEYTK